MFDWRESYLLREMARDLAEGWRDWPLTVGAALGGLGFLWILCAWAAM